METFVSTSPPLEASASTVDELTMQQSLLFSDSLEDLKMLRSQLYSAAEYFESTYTDDDQKQIVVNTLKDYAVKALVNTVDHLGSISFKVNGLLHRKFDEVSETELRVSCIERRIRACQEHTDRQGLSQQSLVITAPKFYKRYTLPAAGGGSMPESGSQAVPKHQELDRFQDSAEAHQFQAEIRQKTKDKPPSFRKRQSIRIKHSQRARSSSPAPKVRSQSPSSQPAKVAGGDKRADSPIPTSNAVTRSGSIVRKPSLLKSSSVGVQYPSETQKLASMRLHAERTDDKDSEQNPSKGRKFLKSLLSRRKSRKDEMLYSYLDEY